MSDHRCAGCGETFSAARAHAVTCSGRCRMRLLRRRQDAARRTADEVRAVLTGFDRDLATAIVAEARRRSLAAA